MASTATNKQPLLIDRPLHNAAIVNGSSGSATPDLGAAGVTGTLLVDCTGNDGALVEDIYAISRGTAYIVNLYLSNFNDLLRPDSPGSGVNTVFIAAIDVPATLDDVANAELLPRVLAPTLQAAQLRALYVPKGRALWATLRRADVGSITTGPVVGAQGGFY